MARAKPAAIIADGDGVLFNSIPGHRIIRPGLKKEFPDMALDSGGLNSIAFLKSRGFTDEDIEKYLCRWQELETKVGVRVFPETNETLKYLKGKGILVGALTNRGPRPHNLKIYKESGLDFSLLDFFILHSITAKPSLNVDHANCMYDPLSRYVYCLTPFFKPDPRAISPVQHSLAKLHGYPQSIYYMGDNPIDLQFSRGNGFTFIGVLSGEINNPCKWIECGLDLIGGDLLTGNISELRQIF